MTVPPAARRIWGLMYRHLALYRHSWPRLLELAYWPTLQMCIWGFTASFFATRIGSTPAVAWACCSAACCCGRLRCAARWASRSASWRRSGRAIWAMSSSARSAPGNWWPHSWPCRCCAWPRVWCRRCCSPGALYAFNLFALGPVLILFALNLIVMGWWVSLGVVSLILRHGAGAEALAWSVLFGLTPFSAVFYPVSVLPAVVRPIALALPSAHVFEGMRTVIATGAIAWDQLAWAFGLNILWMAAAAALFARQFRVARERGALLSIGE